MNIDAGISVRCDGADPRDGLDFCTRVSQARAQHHQVEECSGERDETRRRNRFEPDDALMKVAIRAPPGFGLPFPEDCDATVELRSPRR